MFDELLKNFKEPNQQGGKPLPYMLFGKLEYELIREADNTSRFEKKPALFMLPCDGSHAHVEKLSYYLSKGWKLLKWYLPVGEKLDPFKGATDFGDDHDHFLDLENECRRVSGQYDMLDAEKKELRGENEVLQRQLEEAKKRLADSERKAR